MEQVAETENNDIKLEETGKKKRGSQHSRIFRILCIVLASIFAFLTACALFLIIAESVVDRTARVTPSYEKIDISELINKEEWTEEEYDILRHQTGLAPSVLDGFRGDKRLLEFQNALFFKGEIYHEAASYVTPHDRLHDPDAGKEYTSANDYDAPLVPLEAGDVIVTSTCHTFGWRNGHAALVTSATSTGGFVLESITIGYDSEITSSGVLWFRRSANFLVLRLKNVDKEARAEIAKKASEELVGIPYSLKIGLFTKKDQCADGRTPVGTNCSHLVWQAFKNAGYDIDSDGGPVCTGRDISKCDLFEVIQVYGFDVDKRW